MTTKTVFASLAMLAMTAASWSVGSAAASAQTDPAEREQKLQTMLEGARLVGQFTVMGVDGVSRAPQAEQYAVSRLERDAQGRWVFNVSMSYGTQQHTMPVPVTIEWAGDTPMITMTEQTVEGLGTFTARVLLYEGLYAGTWKHGDSPPRHSVDGLRTLAPDRRRRDPRRRRGLRLLAAPRRSERDRAARA
jgi:hypothetical protein